MRRAPTNGALGAAFAAEIALLDPLYTFPSYGTVNGLFQGIGCTDFLFNGAGTAPFGGLTSGTAANVTTSAVSTTGTRVGLLALATGTDTTGRASVGTSIQQMRAGQGRYRFRADIRVPVASDGTDTFTALCGFMDSISSATGGSCGAFVTYTHGTNSGNLVFTTRSASTNTSTNLAVTPVSATAWTSVEIQIDQDLGHAYCYVNGSLAATHTTNIPASTEVFGCLTNIIKSAGTTSRTVDLDLMGLRVTRAAAV